MADWTVTSLYVSADQNQGSILRLCQVASGATINIGDTVALNGSTATNGVTPTVVQGDGNTVDWATAEVIGIAVVSQEWWGETAATAGQDISVCVFGPCYGFSSLTPGAFGYVSDTAGKVADSPSSTHAYIVGQAQTADTLFVNPRGTLAEPY